MPPPPSPPIYGCTDSTQIGYLPNATFDDGSCIEPVYGCTHYAAMNLDTLANVDDGSCTFEIYGCTNPEAVNFFILADIDDGSCLYLGCTDSRAPNFSPRAMLDDGTCEPIVTGCLNSTAVNFSPSANMHDSSMCHFGGCTNSTAKNYEAWADVDDGSCESYVLGCLDTIAANFNSAAERNGGDCLYYGCVHSMALNFDGTANVDDGSCEFTSVYGTIASFGYLQNCRVVVDGFGTGFSQAGELGPEDPWARSSSLGHYTVHYIDEGLVGVQPATPEAGFPCSDSITGASLEAPLRTGPNASMATPLTTVAIGIGLTRQAECIAQGRLGDLAACLSVGGKDIETYLADTVCRNLVPPVPCSLSLQPCNAATGYVDSCSLNGAPISMWHFDALRQYLLGFIPDPAWSAWLVAQVNIVFTVGCAMNSLMVCRWAPHRTFPCAGRFLLLRSPHTPPPLVCFFVPRSALLHSSAATARSPAYPKALPQATTQHRTSAHPSSSHWLRLRRRALLS